MRRKYYIFISEVARYFFIIFDYYKMINLLEVKGYSKVEHFKIKNWHHGFAYFTAYLDGQKVFIKFDTQLNVIKNDLGAYDILKDKIAQHLVKIIDFDFSGNMQYVAYEFESDSKELEAKDLIVNMALIKQIREIINTISGQGVIHRDLKLDNFLLCNNKIKIIDFTFSIFSGAKDLDLNSRRNCNILMGLGKGLNPKPFIWDDYYTIYKILSELNIDEFADYLKEFNGKIGRNIYSVKCKSFSFKIISSVKILVKKVLKLN